jgi:hypothetical protein
MTRFLVSVLLYTGIWQIGLAQQTDYITNPNHQTDYPSYVFDLAPKHKTHLADAANDGFSKSENSTISLPLPDGNAATLSLEYAPIMAPELISKYPEIKSYRVFGDQISGRIGYTYEGFHGILFTAKGTVYIDPIDADSNSYRSYYRSDYIAANGSKQDHFCELENSSFESSDIETNSNRSSRSGETLRKYRLALACTGEYASFHGGTVIGALSAMVVTMNRVNGVYEREVAVILELVENTDELIFLDGNTDPYTNQSGGTMLSENQSTVSSIIGNSNYDIGHVFSTGGGGIASLGCVCSNQNKARGVTGSNSPTGDPFDIDYVAHEMGHQFGGQHTFNGAGGSCTSNRSSNSAFEPGSGSTIMAYAGICAGVNIQSNSDDYFHAQSLNQITSFITMSATCSDNSSTGNNAPVVSVPTGGFSIPKETPFKLDGSATDANNDNLNYCWEQMDLGPSGNPSSPVNDAPIFRSWNPTEETYRVFPRMQNIILGNTVFGETYPTYNRNLTFRLTARDASNGGGGYGFDEIEFDVSEDAGPFVVTSPESGQEVEAENGFEVNWDVANTDQAAVNCQTVNIDLCKYNNTTQSLEVLQNLATATPNDGQETVILSQDFAGGGNYIRVEAADNVFFHLNGGSFTIVSPTPLSEAGIFLTLTPNYDTGFMALVWNDNYSNESGFFIEKSIGDNQNFQLIASVGANQISLTDFDVVMFGKVYYYRVYAKNAVSTSTLSNEVIYEGLGVQDPIEVSFQVYPNPVSSLLTISEFAKSPIETISIRNSIGQLMGEFSTNSNQTIDVSAWSNGQYYITIRLENGTSKTEPFQIINQH